MGRIRARLGRRSERSLRGQCRLAEVTAPHAREEQRQRLRADDVGGNELMLRTDVHAFGDEMKQRRGIDHITGHL
jgi:hypothetical protein